MVEVIISLPIEVWIDAARQGSLSALAQALEACRDELTEIASRLLGSDLRPKVDVSDIVQETLLEAFRDFRKFSGRTAQEWRAWLRQILVHNVHHVARWYRNSAKRDVTREVSFGLVNPEDSRDPGVAVDTTSPSGHAIANEQNEGLRRALSRISERERLLLTLRLQEQCTFDEMGRRLGCSAVAARKSWLRALERLRRILNDV